MALAPLHPCKCGVLVRTPRCERCEKKYQAYRFESFQATDRARGSSRQRGYTTQWDKARKGYLNKHPLCVICEQKDGRVVGAIVVDHIIPHRGDMKLFWDTSNWQPLCTWHHNQKTMQEIATRRRNE